MSERIGNSMPLPLDRSLYSIDAEEAVFLKSQLGGDVTDEELKEHIIAVQEKAFAIFPFPCIHGFSFLRLQMSKTKEYEHVLKIGKEREGAIFLDLGCCFGVETRKVVADGFPAKNVVAVDLYQGFWDLGHDLFKSNSKTCPIHFICGDLLDATFLPLKEPLYQPPSTPAPPVQQLAALAPLQGHASVIHISAVFHLFDEPTQLQLARGLASLLSPLPGSIICGWQLTFPEKGTYSVFAGDMFGHNAASWTEMWTEQVFKKGTVKVDCETVPFCFEDQHDGLLLYWSVTRI